MRICKLLLLLLTIALSTGCEKDTGEGDLPGTWTITKTKGLNGNGDHPPLDFLGGELRFVEGGAFEFINSGHETYSGQWVLGKKQEESNCYTDAEGKQICDKNWNISLKLDAERRVPALHHKSAYFEYLSFTDADHFTARFTAGSMSNYNIWFERVR